jgi:hypothetical protein
MKSLCEVIRRLGLPWKRCVTCRKVFWRKFPWKRVNACCSGACADVILAQAFPFDFEWKWVAVEVIGASGNPGWVTRWNAKVEGKSFDVGWAPTRERAQEFADELNRDGITPENFRKPLATDFETAEEPNT